VMKWLLSCVVVLLAAPAAAGDLPDPATFPPEQQARWPLVVQKCSRCHTLEVALDHAYSATEWYRYMRRMKRLPGAGISEEQAAELYEFLRYFSTRGAR
jgi:hypothetical protein